MTFTHDDIQNRLIEFLYGELDGDARVAFEAHLAACERCRADVTAFQSTRDLARAAVRTGLEDAVPAGVRARILEAAAAAKGPAVATETGSTAARAAAGAGGQKPSPLKSKGRGEERGPFAWLRARWAVPMFVTVAAMGALLLVRETIYREARKPLGEARAPEATVPPSTAPGSEEAAKAGSAAKGDEASNGPADQAPREASEDRSKSERRSVARPAAGIGSGARQRAAPARVVSKKSATAKSASAPARERAAPGKESLDDLLSGVETARPAKRAVNDDVLGRLSADKADGRGFAQPPPPRAGAAPRAPAPAAAPAPKPSSVVMDLDDGEERPQEVQKRRAVARPAEAEAEATMAAEAPAAVSADRDEDRAPPDAAAPLAARAEKLMASQQWAQAAAAYRQLIARFPKHEQVPNWRRRLAVVEAAAARAAPPSK